MRNYMIARSQGHIVLAVVWDKDTGAAKVKMPGPSNIEVEFSRVDVEHGVEGLGTVHWQGQMFQMSTFHHNELVEKFPKLDVEEQYRLADAWCVKKNKEIKNSYQFMSNWLKKAQGGNVAAGNVVY